MAYDLAQPAVGRPELGDLQSVLDQLLGSRNYLDTEAFGTMSDRMRTDFQQRNLRGSGLHAQAMSEALESAAYAGEQGRGSLAAQTYGLYQGDMSQYLNSVYEANQINLMREDWERQRSMGNQQGRAGMWGAFGSLAGTAAGGGFGGGGLSGMFGGGSGGNSGTLRNTGLEGFG